MADQRQKSGEIWSKFLDVMPDPNAKVNAVAFFMEYLKDPQDALIDWNAPADVFSDHEDRYFHELVEYVAQTTGGDPEQIADKNRRTPEQQQALLERSAKIQMARQKMYWDSVYFNARLAIGKVQGQLDQRGVIAVAFYFATHPELNPRDQGTLTEAQTADLKALYERMAAFIAEHYAGADLDNDPATVTEIIRKFAEAENPAGLPPAELHRLQTVASYQLNNSKAFNMLDLAIDHGKTNGQLQIAMSPDRKTKTDVVTYLSLTYQGDSNIKIGGRRVITGFDKAVYNTVSTLYAAGNRQLSAQDIFRTMNGNTKKRPSAAQVERITNSIRKWMYTALYMDMSQELQRQRLTLNDERIVNGKVETQMLQATIGTARTKNGTEVAVFKLAAEPILYTYCKGKKQILTVPIALLDTAEAASNTEGLTAIREYLLQQIELMRNGHRDNPTIRYATIYEETGIEPPKARKDAWQQRDQIKAILNVWKDRGYITGFHDSKTGTAITGVTIEYEPRESHKK